VAWVMAAARRYQEGEAFVSISVFLFVAVALKSSTQLIRRFPIPNASASSAGADCASVGTRS